MTIISNLGMSLIKRNRISFDIARFYFRVERSRRLDTEEGTDCWQIWQNNYAKSTTIFNILWTE